MDADVPADARGFGEHPVCDILLKAFSIVCVGVREAKKLRVDGVLLELDGVTTDRCHAVPFAEFRTLSSWADRYGVGFDHFIALKEGEGMCVFAYQNLVCKF